MSAKDNFETSLAQHIFQNAAIANIGDSSGLQPSAAPGAFYLTLYTVAPTDSAQGTECNYVGYLRLARSRNGASGFTVSGNVIYNTEVATFGQCVSGTMQTAVAFGINKASATGVDDSIIWGPLTGGNLDISVGVAPSFAIGALTVNID